MTRCISTLVSLSLCATSCLWIGPSEHEARLDRDGDGVPAPEDCDDRDPLIHPGLSEVACDLRDNDCDPSTIDGPAGLGGVVHRSVQAAIDAAPAGGVVQVCSGIVQETLTIPSPITLEGVGDTTIDASGLGGAVVSITGAGATLRRLVLTGGAGGIEAFGAQGPVVLEQVVVRGNTASLGGGVRGPAVADLRLRDCTVQDNVADTHGGGIAAYGVVEILDTLVQGNVAQGDGGGLYAEAGALVVASGTTVSGNTASRGGGGWIGDQALIQDGIFSENEAQELGGGVYLAGGMLLSATVSGNTAPLGGGLGTSGGSIDACRVEGNVAGTGGGVYARDTTILGGVISENTASVGAGVAIEGSSAQIESFTEIADNVASEGGGGIAVIDGSLELVQIALEGNQAPLGGGLYALDQGACPLPECALSLVATRLSGNQGGDQPGEGGGGIWTSLPLASSSCDLAINTAHDGGGLYLSDSTATFQGGTMLGNSASERGGALFVASSAADSLVFDTISLSGNEAPDGAALYLQAGGVRCEEATMANHIESSAAIFVAESPGGTNTYTSTDCSYSGNLPADVEVGGAFLAEELGDRFECSRDQGPGSCAAQPLP
ncbi:MAG TPA: hypothetical protein ENK18_11820 [Deltaproteobacteria bacterium]|nr:hypothetical protein [Deltaproteobacteria bacterium]